VNKAPTEYPLIASVQPRTFSDSSKFSGPLIS
jgi:hypothetical protein